MKRLGSLMVAVALLATLGLASACQRTVEVQTGTRIVDTQGRVISEDIKTIRVPAETAGAYRINTITQADASNPQLASLYADAQAAIAAGDLELAADKLSAVIAIDPGYRDAQKQSATIKAGKKVAPDKKPSSPPKAKTTPTEKPPEDIASSLQRWTPDKLVGFTAAKAAVDALAVSREYKPGSGNPAKSLVIVAEQYRNAEDANAALTVNVKRRYMDSSSTFTSHGHDVYFGTDGQQFAVLGFTSGAVMVALEASPDSGSPDAMKAVLVKALGQLP